VIRVPNVGSWESAAQSVWVPGVADDGLGPGPAHGLEGGADLGHHAALDDASAISFSASSAVMAIKLLTGRGVDAVGLSGVDGGLMIAERVPGLGLVAHVVGLRRDFRPAARGRRAGRRGRSPGDEQGTSATSTRPRRPAAGHAAGLGAPSWLLMTNVDGIRDAAGEKLIAMTADEAEKLIAEGVIKGGMVPKIRAALQAVSWPGAEAVICDSRDPHALSRALHDPTFGTRITAGARRHRNPRGDGLRSDRDRGHQRQPAKRQAGAASAPCSI